MKPYKSHLDGIDATPEQLAELRETEERLRRDYGDEWVMGCAEGLREEAEYALELFGEDRPAKRKPKGGRGKAVGSGPLSLVLSDNRPMKENNADTP